MEDLQAALESADWPVALSTARSLGVPASYVHKHHYLRQPDVVVLAQVDDDPVWVANAALSTPFFDSQPTEQAKLVKLGLDATERWVNAMAGLAELLKEEGKSGGKEREGATEELRRLLSDDMTVRAACEARWAMLERAKRWEAYCEIYSISAEAEEPVTPAGMSDDPWADQEDDEDAAGWQPMDSGPASGSISIIPADALPFSRFCELSLEELAMDLAASLQLRRSRILRDRYPAISRLRVASSAPLHADPSDAHYGADFVSVLPRSVVSSDKQGEPLLGAAFSNERSLAVAPIGDADVSRARITQWYLDRVAAIDAQLGAVDLAISLVQHGASLEVEGLEPLSEDLSLLSKLVYDTASPADTPRWSLDEWRSQTPSTIVTAYLVNSTPITLETDLRRLVLPYLGTVEARLERTGASASDVAASTPQLLREWALSSAAAGKLSLFAAFIKTCSPSRKSAERILRDDTEVARIALAGLYTSRDDDSWESMTAIFECMPAFEDTSPPASDFSARSTLRSLLQATDGFDPSTVYDALISFSPGELAAMLDVLDDDLASAELLARWNVAVPLRQLVGKVAGDKREQSKLALRMARQDGGANVESEDEWLALLEAMGMAGEQGKIFELLGRQEAVKIFFGGLLSSGKFKLARSLFHPSTGKRPVDPDIQEELVLNASREFYDNAESGNQNVGEMKLALECLGAAPQTVAVRQERDFIEATSRLTSFRLQSEPGIPLSPLQIRLAKDKLTLIAKLLETSEDAYHHPDMILDLVAKLGLRGDKLAEVRTLALITDAALKARDPGRAMEICDRMVQTVHALRKAPQHHAASGATEQQAAQAAEVAWRTCAQLGSGPTGTKEVRQKLLGHALILCPPTEIAPLLANWRIVDQLPPGAGAGADHQRRPSLVGTGVLSPPTSLHRLSTAMSAGSSGSRPQSPFVGFVDSPAGDAATRAARTFGRAAALFPFGSHGRPRSATPNSDRGSGSKVETPAKDQQQSQPLFSPPLSVEGGASPTATESHADRLTAALSNRFTSGVGWLIGADAS